ncbi:hypothetical protein B7L70_06965 [Vulcanisaeta sp. EB80]|nr:hypothetical protein B7L70_06965 [Vulcanisaeta sp. EB80]
MMVGFVFVGGVVYSSFEPLVRADSLVVVNGRVAYVGSEDKALRIADTLGLNVIDLRGRVVMPGFIDSHAHLDSLGISLNSLDLRGVDSIEELKRRLREYADRVRTRWVYGRGWDQELFREGRWPSRFDLDSVINDRPVALVRVCGHAAVLNTKALELSGLLNSRDPDVVRDERGEPTGVVVERTLDRVRELINESYTVSDYEDFILSAMRYAASLGVTTIGFVSVNLRSLQALVNLESKLGALPIRVRIYLNPEDHGVLPESLLRPTPHSHAYVVEIV